MQRYFMHLHNSIGFVPDREGILASDLEAVRQLAIVNIRSLLSEELALGRLDLSGRIEVMDEAQQLVLCVPFGQAVTVIGSTA